MQTNWQQGFLGHQASFSVVLRFGDCWRIKTIKLWENYDGVIKSMLCVTNITFMKGACFSSFAIQFISPDDIPTVWENINVQAFSFLTIIGHCKFPANISAVRVRICEAATSKWVMRSRKHTSRDIADRLMVMLMELCNKLCNSCRFGKGFLNDI